MQCARLLVGLLVFALGVSLLGALMGAFNVSATEPHWPTTLQVISFIRERSIRKRANQEKAPHLGDAGRIRAGFHRYQEMCVTCHSAPGRGDSVIRIGLNPQSPLLTESRVQERPDADLCWIIKHGIRMTVMPAFGKTHSDDQIWDLVAFVRHLAQMSAEEYKTWDRHGAGERSHDDHGHRHDYE
ncbi:MAG: hypothetical protein C4293_01625 [Nitrospiraceae bacterium]